MVGAVILSCFLKALLQLGDPQFRRVLVFGVGLSLLLLAGASISLFALLRGIFDLDRYIPVIGNFSWASNLLSWGSLATMLAISIFLMVPVATVIISILLEPVVQSVETIHYPGLPPATPMSFSNAVLDLMNFIVILIAANIGALLLSLLFFPVAPLIFWTINGYLIGREYFQMIAARRMERSSALALRRQHTSTIWLAGTLIALPLSIPLLNLILPIFAAATFSHLFHHLAPTASG